MGVHRRAAEHEGGRGGGWDDRAVTGKAFAAGVRSLMQGIVVVILSALLGVALTDNPLKLLASAGFLVLGSAFFSCLSMTIAGIALQRDRLMGIGQAITMPLFFSSSALYPTRIMPGWRVEPRAEGRGGRGGLGERFPPGAGGSGGSSPRANTYSGGAAAKRTRTGAPRA